MALFWFFPALPYLAINDPKLIEISLDSGLFFSYLVIAYILFLPFRAQSLTREILHGASIFCYYSS